MDLLPVSLICKKEVDFIDYHNSKSAEIYWFGSGCDNLSKRAESSDDNVLTFVLASTCQVRYLNVSKLGYFFVDVRNLGDQLTNMRDYKDLSLRKRVINSQN